MLVLDPGVKRGSPKPRLGSGAARKPTDLELEKTPPRRAARERPAKGGSISEDAWRILDEVSQRTNTSLRVQQGGRNTGGDPTSKGTHDGGGAVDLFVNGMTPQQQLDVVSELRNQGVAAWLRTPEYGWNVPNDDHIHAIFMNDPDLSPVAREQVKQYKRGQNGLANHGPDPFPRTKVTARNTSRTTKSQQAPEPTGPGSRVQPTPLRPPAPEPTGPGSRVQPTPLRPPAPEPTGPGSRVQPTPSQTSTPKSNVSLDSPALGKTETPPTPTPAPTAAPAPAPTSQPVEQPLQSGYGAGGYAPAQVPHPDATGFDAAKTQGQSAPGVTPTEPTQREEYEVDFLRSLGWTAPDQYSTKPPQKLPEMYSPNSRTPLAAYTYQVDAAERDRITSKYRNVEGFMPPSDTQGLPNPDTVPYEAEVETAELTWEAYDKLSDEQRTAVDLNGLLVAARNLDLSKEWKLEGDELNEYNSRATAIFGKPDTSVKVAPNVVHLLTDINWSAVGQDLDEFLSLERAFTVDDLKDLDTRSPEFEKLMETRTTTQPNQSGYGPREAITTTSSNFDKVRSAENVASADAFLAQKAGERFDAVMADPALRLWDLPSTLQLAQTGTTVRPTGAAVPIGYGVQSDRTTEQGKAQEAFYQSAYNYLATASNTDLQPLWDEMTAMDFTPEDTNAFWRFVDDRTRQERRWGQVGSPYQAGGNYRTADEIRKLVGLEG